MGNVARRFRQKRGEVFQLLFFLGDEQLQLVRVVCRVRFVPAVGEIACDFGDVRARLREVHPEKMDRLLHVVGVARRVQRQGIEIARVDGPFVMGMLYFANPAPNGRATTRRRAIEIKVTG